MSDIYVTETRLATRAEGGLYQSTTFNVGTAPVVLTFDTVANPLLNVTLIGSSEIEINTNEKVDFHLEPQFNRSSGGGTEDIVVWYETSLDGITWTKGEAIFNDLNGGDSSVSPLTLFAKGMGKRVRFVAQGTVATTLNFRAIPANTLTADHPIIPAYILTIT